MENQTIGILSLDHSPVRLSSLSPVANFTPSLVASLLSLAGSPPFFKGGRGVFRKRNGRFLVNETEDFSYTKRGISHRLAVIRREFYPTRARRAKQQLPPWLQQTSEELGLAYSGVSIRGQRTRWGSCSAKGRINLNYALLFLEPDLVRYLFVHELCHTVHLNHSRRYWELVESKEPHYRYYEKGLKLASSQVPAWLHSPFPAHTA